jgi:hypothetical protein
MAPGRYARRRASHDEIDDRLPSKDQLCAADRRGKENAMLWTICLILVILWLLGIVSSYTLGGFIHLLLFLAISIVLIRIIQGRKPIT